MTRDQSSSTLETQREREREREMHIAGKVAQNKHCMHNCSIYMYIYLPSGGSDTT